jgi:hypothetical protein
MTVNLKSLQDEIDAGFADDLIGDPSPPPQARASDEQPPPNRYGGPGYSIAAFSRASGIPYRRVEKAIRAGEIEALTLGGVTRIPENELARVLRVLGAEVTPLAKVGRGSDQFALRLPDGLRDRIKAAAERAGRSMNAEIVRALEKEFAH